MCCTQIKGGWSFNAAAVFDVEADDGVFVSEAPSRVHHYLFTCTTVEVEVFVSTVGCTDKVQSTLRATAYFTVCVWAGRISHNALKRSTVVIRDGW